jgi:subtilase family serine protease
VAIYDSYDYGSAKPWVEVGGTSVSTPCWAALMAVTNQGRLANGLSRLNTAGPTQTQAFLYGLPSADFHDVTSGSNGGYAAGVGYDEVTGLEDRIGDMLDCSEKQSSLSRIPNPDSQSDSQSSMSRIP